MKLPKQRVFNAALPCAPSHKASSEAVPQKLDEADKDDNADEDDADADGPVRLIESVFCCLLLSLRPVKYLLREVLHPLCK